MGGVIFIYFWHETRLKSSRGSFFSPLSLSRLVSSCLVLSCLCSGLLSARIPCRCVCMWHLLPGGGVCFFLFIIPLAQRERECVCMWFSSHWPAHGYPTVLFSAVERVHVGSASPLASSQQQHLRVAPSRLVCSAVLLLLLFGPVSGCTLGREYFASQPVTLLSVRLSVCLSPFFRFYFIFIFIFILFLFSISVFRVRIRDLFSLAFSHSLTFSFLFLFSPFYFLALPPPGRWLRLFPSCPCRPPPSSSSPSPTPLQPQRAATASHLLSRCPSLLLDDISR